MSACLSVEPMSLKLNIHGGRSLQNRSKRFVEVVSKVPGPGAYNVLPASGNTLRAVTADEGQAEKLGRKMVGIWVKLRRRSKRVVKLQKIINYRFSPSSLLCSSSTVG